MGKVVKKRKQERHFLGMCNNQIQETMFINMYCLDYNYEVRIVSLV